MVKADHIAFKRVVWHEKFVNTSSDHISAFYVNCTPRVLHGMSVFPRRTLKNGSCTPMIFGPKYMNAPWTTWPTDSHRLSSRGHRGNFFQIESAPLFMTKPPFLEKFSPFQKYLDFPSGAIRKVRDTRFFYIRNRFIRNLHVEGRNI